MWEGWTEKEVAEMIREVQLDCNIMIAFHERVLRSQFWLWTLVPVFGWVSAPSRWISMKRNWQKYEAWARSSRVALIRNEIVVVSLPQCSCTDPPQTWPRQRVPVSSIVQVRSVDPSGRTCCVPNTLSKVRMKVAGQRDAMEIVGIHDELQFVEDVQAIAQGTWPLAAPQAACELVRETASGVELESNGPSSHTNPLFDSAVRQNMEHTSNCPRPHPGESPRRNARKVKAPQLSTIAADASASSSPEKPSPLDLAMSNSRLLLPEETLASLQPVSGPLQAPASSHVLDANDGSRPVLQTDTIHGSHQQESVAQFPAPQTSDHQYDSSGNNAAAAADTTFPDAIDKCQSNHDNEDNGLVDNGLVRASWCWEVESSANDTIDQSSIDSETLNAYASDLEEMVRESKKRPPCASDDDRDGTPRAGQLNLVEEIQPYDGPPLGCEAAEYWGPEWLEDDGGLMDERLASMTKEEADAIVLGARLPPVPAAEFDALPGADAAWRKFPEAMPRAIAESRLAEPLREAEETLDMAIREVHMCKHDPVLRGHTEGLLALLGNIRETMDGIADMSGQTRRQSTKAPGGKAGLNARALIAQFTR